MYCEIDEVTISFMVMLPGEERKEERKEGRKEDGGAMVFDCFD